MGMHVGLYSPMWPLRDASNGIVTYVHWLRQGLRANGHRVSVFTTFAPGRDEAEDDVHVLFAPKRGVVARLLRTKADMLGDRIAASMARQILAFHRRDPLDVFEMEESFGWFQRLAEARQFGVVVKLHGPAFQTLVGRDRENDAARRKIDAEGRALGRAQAITAPSRAALDGTLAFYGLHPRITARILNPLTLDPATPLWDPRTCDGDTVLFVGRFDEVKGGDRVLQIFQRALARRPTLRLIFVGPDHGIEEASTGRRVQLAELVARLFSETQAKQVSVLGRQPPARIAQLRAEATLVIVPSRWETQGYTAIEAMLQGCPVVCADTSGLREAVVPERNGLLFDGDDVDQGAAQVLRLVQDRSLAARLGQQAREDVSAAHDPRRVAEETAAVYRRLLDTVA